MTFRIRGNVKPIHPQNRSDVADALSRLAGGELIEEPVVVDARLAAATDQSAALRLKEARPIDRKSTSQSAV